MLVGHKHFRRRYDNMNDALIYETVEFDAERYPNLARFLKIWDGYRGDRFAPSWNDIDLLDFAPTLIPYIFIVDVDQISKEFFFRFVGTKVVEIEGKDYTGCKASDLQWSGGEASIQANYEAFITDPKPIFYVVKAMNLVKQYTDIYAGLRLPISSDGVSVDKFLNMINCDDDLVRDKYEKFHDLMTAQPSE